MTFKAENSIGFLINQASRTLRSKVHSYLKEQKIDVTMEQGGVLMRLWMKDGQSQTELAQFLCKDKTTIARLLDGMEKTSLVVRIPSVEDKRSNLVYLTQKGKEIQGVIKENVMKVINEAVEGVAPKDIEICKQVLRKVYENIGSGQETCS